jgi:hypothetical protein
MHSAALREGVAAERIDAGRQLDNPKLAIVILLLQSRLLYGIRLKSSWGVSCCLRPPMVVGQIPYRLGLIEQLDATLHQRIFYFEDLLEESVCYGLIAQRP